jgi:beta-barrel assembly-enhancing protease
MSFAYSARVAVAVVLALSGSGAATAQTAAGPSNGYTPKDDVEIGREAASVVERRLSVLHDEAVARYLASVVGRLVAAIPSELQYPEFHYSVEVIDMREPNAHALPGGPIYVNRGLIEAAHAPAELAGVIAHELGHVALRHVTAQATRLAELTVAALTRALLGARDENRAGGIQSEPLPADGAAALLRVEREYERQADALGLRVMACAGYDPRGMAAAVSALGRTDRTGPTDRAESRRRHDAIIRQAASLRVEHPVHDRAAFERARARLRAMGRGPSLTPKRPNRIEPASARFTTYTEWNLFRVRVPSNWRELPDGNAIVFTPPGGSRDAGGQMAFTHGVEIGLAPRQRGDLLGATDALIDLLATDNPSLRRRSDFDRVSLANQPAVRAVLANASEVTGREERMEIVTTLLRDGRLFYALAVAPRPTFAEFQPTFRLVISSIAIIE